jgi:hypothetical protein
VNRFVLQKLDIATNCFLEQSLFSTKDVTTLSKITGVDSIEPGMSFYLDADEFCLIADSYFVEIGRDAECGELICVSENFRIDPKSHTGRELLMMLSGDKPFAAFVDIHPSNSEDEIIPETYFEEYVKSGRILKFEHIERQNEKTTHSLRRVMYALPGNEWRVNAYLMIWKLAYKYGWNEGFEQIEGYLLGYEDNRESLDNSGT